MKLYELATNYKEIEEKLETLVDESTGAIQELKEFEKAMSVKEDIERELLAKSDNMLRFLRNSEANIEALDFEIKRLKYLKEKKEKAIERLKVFIKEFMLSQNIKKLAGDIGSFSIRESKAVNVFDEALLDKKFIKVKTTYSVDKIAIKDAIKSGEEVQGAKIDTNKSLVVK